MPVERVCKAGRTFNNRSGGLPSRVRCDKQYKSRSSDVENSDSPAFLDRVSAYQPVDRTLRGYVSSTGDRDTAVWVDRMFENGKAGTKSCTRL